MRGVDQRGHVVHLRVPRDGEGLAKQRDQNRALLRWTMRHLAQNPKAKKPLNKSLRAIVNDPQNANAHLRRMDQFRSESDVHKVRRIGPQTGAEIIRLMKRLGWQPRPSQLDFSCAVGSATDCLIKIAARARRHAKANPPAAEELAKLAAQASDIAGMLTQLRGQMHDSPTAAPGTTPGTRD